MDGPEPLMDPAHPADPGVPDRLTGTDDLDGLDGLDGLDDAENFEVLSPWGTRGRRAQDRADATKHVLLELPAGSGDPRTWEAVAREFAEADPARLVIPRLARSGGGTWLVYEDLPEHTFAQEISRQGGGVQDQVLGMVADLAEGLAILHDHGWVLRRLSLRDVVRAGRRDLDGVPTDTGPESAAGWRLMLTPDAGIRPVRPGREPREIDGDLVMLASAAVTVLTGRRPAPGRERTPLTLTCPSLPSPALEALEALLAEHAEASAGECRSMLPPATSTSPASPGQAARDLAAVIRGGAPDPQRPARRAGTAAGEARTQPGGSSTGPEITSEDSTGQTVRNQDTEAPAVTEDLPAVALSLRSSSGREDGTERVLELLGRAPVKNPASPGRARPRTARPWDGGPLEIDDEQPNTRTGAGNRPRWVLAVAGVLTVVGVAISVFALSPEENDPEQATEAGQARGSAQSSQAAASLPDSDGTGRGPGQSPPPDDRDGAEPESTQGPSGQPQEDAQRALGELVTTRATALRTADPQLLEEVYVPGASALKEDRATIETLTMGRAGDGGAPPHAFSDLTMSVGQVQFVGTGPDTASGAAPEPYADAPVGAVRESGTVVLSATIDAEGLAPGQQNSQDVEVTLTKTEQGWRIAEVEPQ